MPIAQTALSINRIIPFTVRFGFISMVKFVLLLALCFLSTALRAQTLEIKLVDGRNGRPIAGKCINVWVGDRSAPSSGPLLQTETGKNGSATFHLTHEDSEINNKSERLSCGLSGVIDPTAKYGDTIGIRAGYVLCQPHTPDYSWLAMTDFSTEKVLRHGILTDNTCGNVTSSVKPGEVILFVRPLTWWEKLKQ